MNQSPSTASLPSAVDSSLTPIQPKKDSLKLVKWFEQIKLCNAMIKRLEIEASSWSRDGETILVEKL